MSPLVILIIGIVTVIGMIIWLRVNAFIALITAAILVSLLAPGETSLKIKRVAEAFGDTAADIGIVIGLAAVIGKCMMDSGAADRIVRAFFNVLGEKRASMALMGSGYVLAIPVFFDTVFYLLVPLARALWRRTGKNFLMYVMAIGAGGAITHTLVPPTPGPLIMAETLNVQIGTMILVGACVAVPPAIVGLLFAGAIDRWLAVPVRSVSGETEPEPLDDSQMPSLLMSLLPVVLPVLMITSNTVVDYLASAEESRIKAAAELDPTAKTDGASVTESGSSATVIPKTALRRTADVTALIGNPNLALLVSTAIAMFVLLKQRQLSFLELGHAVEIALMSGGVIILITAAGGAFGKMLKEAQIEQVFQQGGGLSGMGVLWLGFGLAALMKVAQGSGTVSMITASGMVAAVIPPAETLGFHPVYVATAIGSGSLICSWMNDSGFWVVAKMSGLTETEALKSWTVMLILLGIAGMVTTLVLATVLPLV